MPETELGQPETHETLAAHAARETYVVHFFRSTDGELRCRVTDVRRRESRLIGRPVDVLALLGEPQPGADGAR